MDKITFEQVPERISWILEKLDRIELAIQSTTIQEQTNTDQLLTIEEASELLMLAKATVYGLVSRSEIPHSKKGKRLYFSRNELLDWIKSGRKKTVSEIEAEAESIVNRNRS